MGKSGNPAKRAALEAADPIEYDPTPLDSAGVEDFDAFWQSQERTGIPVRIRGEVVTLPPALPLQFELVARRKKNSKDPRDTEKLVGILFGEDALTKWAGAGMDSEEFAVLLAWATQRIGGGTMSMAEVAAKLQEAEGADPR